jgi:hypothetical protein
MYANLIRKLNKTVQSEKFIARHRKSSKDFTRTRQLPFHILIYFLLNLVKGSLQDELDHYFKTIYGTELPERVVTKSAFSLARKKLQPSAFETLTKRPWIFSTHSLMCVFGEACVCSALMARPFGCRTLKQ